MDAPTKSDSDRIYYCSVCSDYLFLAKGCKLETAPIRPVDKSWIIDENKKDVFTTCREGESVVIKRDRGFERQSRLHCSTCGTTVAYHQHSQFIYILPGSVVPG
ncbi:hypothetical protein HDV03_001094 [Kappamyces sp. JEL0829]|nr:hypothetical protein HDV03_001094 [Kappamyces sp. JEL0829]